MNKKLKQVINEALPKETTGIIKEFLKDTLIGIFVFITFPFWIFKMIGESSRNLHSTLKAFEEANK